MAIWAGLSLARHDQWTAMANEFASMPLLLGAGVVLVVLGCWELAGMGGRFARGVTAFWLASTVLWQSVLFPLGMYEHFVPRYPAYYVLMPLASLVAVVLAFAASAKMLRAEADPCATEVAGKRWTVVLSSVLQVLAGLLVAMGWWWMTSPRPGNGNFHFEAFIRVGPFLVFALVLVGAGIRALASVHPATWRACGLVGSAVVCSESVLVVTTYRWRAVFLAGTVLGLTSSALLLRAGNKGSEPSDPEPVVGTSRPGSGDSSEPSKSNT
jgi:hypothetical protein